MADEGHLPNGKFNETCSKSIILQSLDGKKITKHTSIHITRLNGASTSALLKTPASDDDNKQPAAAAAANATAATIDTKPFDGLSGRFNCGLPRIRRACSSVQISVNIRSPSNDLFRQSTLPVKRSNTFFESSWTLSSTCERKLAPPEVLVPGISLVDPIRSKVKAEQAVRETLDRDGIDFSSTSSPAPNERSKVSKGSQGETMSSIKSELDIEVKGHGDLLPSKVSIHRETTSLSRLAQTRPAKSPQRFSSEVKGDSLDSVTFERLLSIPLDGWSLKDAIEKGQLDPITGMFLVDGQDLGMTLKDCLRLKVINPVSADVVDPSRPFVRPTNLTLALERGLIDETGNYLGSDRQSRMSLKEALQRRYVAFNEKVRTSGLVAKKVLKINRSSPSGEVKVTLEPESLYKSNSKSESESRKSTIDGATSEVKPRQETDSKPKVDFVGQIERMDVAYIDDEREEDDKEVEDRDDKRDAIENIIRTDLTLVEDESENWSDIVAEIDQRLEVIKEFEKFPDTYSSIKSWLTDVEERLEAMEPIGSDLKLIQTQRQELNNIRREFKAKQDQLRAADESSRSCKDKMECDSNEYRQIVSLEAKLGRHWEKCSSLLEEKEKRLKNLHPFCEQFTERLEKLQGDLETIQEEFEDLQNLDLEPGEKSKRLESLEERLSFLRPTINECEVISDHLYQLVSDPVKVKDIRSKFNQAEIKQRQLSDDLETLGKALEKFEKFQAVSSDFQDWEAQMADILSQEVQLSTNESDLKEELAKLQEMNETIAEMEEKFQNLSQFRETREDEVESSSVRTLESQKMLEKLEKLSQTWNHIKTESKQRLAKVESSLEQCVKIKSRLIAFDTWLDEVEVDLSNIPDLTFDPDTLERSIKEIDRIRSKLSDRKPEYLEISDISLDCFNKEVNQARGEINSILNRWDDFAKNLDERQTKLEAALNKLTGYRNAARETQSEAEKLQDKIASSNVLTASSLDPRLVEKVQAFLAEVNSLEKKAVLLENEAKNLSEGQKPGSDVILAEASAVTTKVSSMREDLEKRSRQMISAKVSAEKVQKQLNGLQRSADRLAEVVGKLAPVGRETRLLEKQRRETDELRSDVEKLGEAIDEANKLVEQEKSSLEGFQVTYRNFLHTLRSIETRRSSNLSSLIDRAGKIESAMKEAKDFEESLKSFEEWLSSAETWLNKMDEPSLLLTTVEGQLEDIRRLQEEFTGKREALIDLERKSSKRDSKDNPVGIIRNRWTRLTSSSTKRARTLDRNVKQARDFNEKLSSLLDWLSSVETILESARLSDGDSISSLLGDLRELSRDFDHKQAHLENICRLGRSLREKSGLKTDQAEFQRILDDLKSRWTVSHKNCAEALQRLERTQASLERYRKLVKKMKDWLGEAILKLDGLHGDVDTVTKLVKDHSNFQKQLALKNDTLIVLKDLADDLMVNLPAREANEVSEEIVALSEAWDDLNARSQEKDSRLREAITLAEQLKRDVNKLLNWLIEVETSLGKIKFPSPSGADEPTLRGYLDDIQRYSGDLRKEEAFRDQTIALAQSILLDCHPDANYAVRHYIELIETTWDELTSLLRKKEAEVQTKLDETIRKAAILNNLTQWLEQSESEGQILDSKVIPNEIELIQGMINELEDFKESISSKEPEMEKLVQEYRIPLAAKSRRKISSERNAGTAGSLALDVNLDQIGHSRAQDILKRWRGLLARISDRLIRLRSKLNFYMELEKLRDFDFDGWRRRFMDWLDKRRVGRIAEFFRKLDENRDNKVNYEEFVDGFLRLKFPASRSELQRVAAIFDRDNDGFIDFKEWTEKLRDTSEESELIVSEMAKQSEKCTCSSKYRVHRVEDKKYLFGESQKLRLVRILRSDIMVRIGGGWISLNEFLLKNDPCRAKGRTNVELREPLADGVSQSMAAFQSRSPFFSNHFMGPITNIREKTERSVPMSSHGVTRDSDDSSDSLNDIVATGAGSSSRPQSRLSFAANDDRCPSRGSHHLFLETCPQQKKILRIDTRPGWH